MKAAPRRGGVRLVPFGAQTSEGGLVRCQLTLFI